MLKTLSQLILKRQFCSSALRFAKKASPFPIKNHSLSTPPNAKTLHGNPSRRKEAQLNLAMNTGKGRVLALFQGIYGVGPVTAGKWYNEGLRTLNDVSMRADLTDQQRCGLEHYADFSGRIPRLEVTKHYQIIKCALGTIDRQAQVYCMGSYRRGQVDCGDVDVIITKDGASFQELQRLLFLLLQSLQRMGYAKFTFGRQDAESMRWLGAAALDDGIWRRVDILLVPTSDLAAALVYYTGNNLVNKSLRGRAMKLGLRLNERGLFSRDPNDTENIKKHRRLPADRGERIPVETEKDLFERLGVEYLEPEERNLTEWTI